MPTMKDYNFEQWKYEQTLLNCPLLGVGWSPFTSKEYVWNANYIGSDRDYYFYPLPTEGRILVIQYNNLTDQEKPIAGAVFADWLEENREYLLIEARGPTDPAKRLDELIAYLRSRL